jgi:hypothetical protein
MTKQKTATNFPRAFPFGGFTNWDSVPFGGVKAGESRTTPGGRERIHAKDILGS